MKKQPSVENCDVNLLTLPAGETAVPEGCSISPDADGTAFQNLKLLGMGGMGIVYEAEDQALERKVALKMLRTPYRYNRTQVNKFIKEARLTAKIDHPNIIAVHHLGYNQDCGTYFSMRRIKGETLQKILRRLRSGDADTARQYTVRRMLNIFVAACNGVAAAHQLGILHCDLKPSNIMIGDRGEVWVLDWGVARETGDPVTAENSVEGTPAFMAPELLCGKKSAPDQATEVYALGTILHCMLTWNEAPVDLSLPPEELQKNVINGKLLPLRRTDNANQLQQELTAICRKALARDPEKRYPDVNALLTDIHNYQDDFPVSAYSRYPFYRWWKLLHRRPLIPIACLAAIVTFTLYHFSGNLIDYTRDKSMLRQAEYNATLADSLIRQTRMQHQQLSDPDGNTDIMTVIRDFHKVQNGINLAMLEIFAAFDALNGASDTAVKSFMDVRGSVMCKHLLRLQMLSGDPLAPVRTLEKIRRRREQLLDFGCESDPELQKLVARIDSGCAELFINNRTSQPWQSYSVTASDGSIRSADLGDTMRLKLPAGGNWIAFTGSNGEKISAFYHSIPGTQLRLTLPERPAPPGFVCIPADHWQLQIPQSEPVLKLLPEYLISAQDIKVMDPENKRRHAVTATQAKKYCLDAGKILQKKVRLPSELELRKSLTVYPGSDPGKSFYGAELPAGDRQMFVRGSNGNIRIFDTAKNRSRALRQGDTAVFRVVIE